MLRHCWKLVLFVAVVACLAHDAQAASPPRRKPVVNYLFGGYGPGPFGKGDFVYNGYPTFNYQAKTRVRHH